MAKGNEYIEKIKSIVLLHTKEIDCKVYLFGSRATKKAGRLSDVDIGILAKSALPRHFLSIVREALEESNVPYSVDVVDLSTVSGNFRQKVFAEGILWRE